MKKILYLIIISFLFTSISIAQEWITTNQATIAYEQDFGGIPVAEVQWNIYLANALTDPQKTNPVQIATTSSQQYVVTLNVEGRFFVGVSAQRTINETVIGESDILWADTQVDVPAFGLQYFVIPPMPTSIIKQ